MNNQITSKVVCSDSKIIPAIPNNKLQSVNNFTTSTPLNKLTKSMDEFCKFTNRTINNDSGFVSQMQESNSCNSGEFLTTMLSESSKSIYLSEDALLEQPIIKKDNCNENSESSIIQSSVTSVATNFSGLEWSDNSDSDQSDIIKVVEPIIVRLSENFDTLTNTQCENKKIVVESKNKTESIVTNSNRQINQDYGRKIILTNKLNAQTPLKTYKNNVNSNLSPDLFSDEDEPIKSENSIQSYKLPVVEKYILQNDKKLIKRVNDSLNGVLPPPSVTIVCLTVQEMLEKIKENQNLFWKNLDNSTNSKNIEENQNKKEFKSMLITGEKEDCINIHWPNIMEPRYHGLHYNRSKLSEDFESLCSKYAQRYVGIETQSSCTVFDTFNESSPSKRKSNRLRWVVKSPGRRLSHLARRRITFSNSTITTASGNSCNIGRARQILVGARKLELLNRRKSPKKKSPRKTPRKSPRVRGRTPSSSAKKRLALQFCLLTDEERQIPRVSSAKASSTKRALFQSPEHSHTSSKYESSTFGILTSSNSIKKKSTLKRALFTSPVKNSVQDDILEKKRKRLESDDTQPLKLSRTMSCSSTTSESASQKSGGNLSQSTSELSAHHKKKLQWAVYEALRSQNVGVSHQNFKIFASVLARVTRRFLPNLMPNAPRPEGGTSERMLRIARQHVFAVTKGKSVEEIVQEYEKSRAKVLKPTGYISINESANKKTDIAQARYKENILQDKINIMNSLDKKRLELNREKIVKPRLTCDENNVERIRKAIDFGSDNNIR